MAVHILEEAQRCLNCKKPQCMEGCPIRTPIPKAISLMLGGNLNEAGRMLFENNPLTTVCSLVCNHEKQCEGHCILGKKGAPIRFSSIENYISSTYSNQMTQGPAEKNGMRAAIVGSGPAGLTIAVVLARKGYQVTIFEDREKLGGMLRYGIPDFRLPESILDDFEYRHLVLKEIDVRPNTHIGEDITVDDLLADGYKAIFVGTGVWQPRKLGVPGETLGHVHYAIHYLARPDSYRLGRTLVVIGAGNAAMDVCRTAVRKGVRRVICVSRTDKVSAARHEFEYARLEGVEFLYNRRAVRITDEGVYLAAPDAPGEPELVRCDSVVISIGQGPRNRIVSTTQGLKADERGLLVADECGRTTRPGIFASGDVTSGARTVVEAVAHSKKVAEAMDAYMRGESAPCEGPAPSGAASRKSP